MRGSGSMRRTLAVTAALFWSAMPWSPASASCETGITVALHRAAPLPATSGKAALLEQIQRAEIARHEGDEGDCIGELSVATHVLDEIDVARRKPSG